MTLFVATVFMYARTPAAKTPAEIRTANADESRILLNLSHRQCGNKTVRRLTVLPKRSDKK